MNDHETITFECQEYGTVCIRVDSEMNIHKYWLVDANQCGSDNGSDSATMDAINRAFDSHLDRLTNAVLDA